jgi:hypothetical protein
VGPGDGEAAGDSSTTWCVGVAAAGYFVWVSLLDDVAKRDGWRCWVCDEPVDPGMSVNDPRGPSVDSRTADRKAKVAERLAHRGCNTRKGAVKVVIAWPERLYVVEPAPLITVAGRLERKGGREMVGRCPTRKDAQEAADWLVDRFSRLVPGLPVTADIEAGGGQFLVILATGRR